MNVKIKINRNKRNNQLTISLPRSKLGIKGSPKFLVINKKNIKLR